jgi:Ras GTPase-activating-like protein IQGAP2/3
MSKKNKRALAYGDNLSNGRRLGRHLPRIASGDGDDSWVEERKEDIDRRRRRETRERERRARVSDATKLPPAPAPAPAPTSPRKQEIAVAVVTDSGDVAGIPGRLRLSRDKTPSTPVSPLPSARLGRGLWADTQRQHLQAYEYLCHVGEAQQWIEGCLEEELGFGVVEMEEGLRNGVVLAKLVRAFQGEKVVRRIYEVWQEIPPLLAQILTTIVNRRQSWTFDTLITSTFSLTSSGRLAFPR